MRFITPRSVIAATVAVTLVSASAVASLGVQRYFDEREIAVSAMQNSTNVAAETATFSKTLLTEAEAAITAASQTLAASEGKTLTSAERDALSKTIATATKQLETLRTVAASLDETVRQAQSAFAQQLAWPPTAQHTAEELYDEVTGSTNALVNTLVDLASDIEAVSTAQLAWQAEQDRIAAEAAAEAAARRAAAAAARSTLKPSGGSTAPNVQAAPPPIATSMSTAEAFLRQYVPASMATLTWVPNLCQPGYICGLTVVGGGQIPEIRLMGTASAPANYDWAGGRYVLVHEAAHARQYWLYGSVAAMISESERFTAVSGVTGVAAVEWMADCATIVKIGYAGTYTSSCTPEQLAEAARVW